MASRTEIIEAIEGLAVHCRPPLMGVDERTRWFNDWCDDLKEFSALAVETGCKRWRQGSNPKFPLPGQLLPLVRAAHTDGNRGVKPQAWRPLSDAEYAALSLTEKIRDRQIMATEAFSRAGPQKGPAEEMPEAWHMHRRLGKQYAAEAAELRKKLQNARENNAQPPNTST